ncbi:MAG TPA: HypC/HybG/HupF family hydrogenase formation chaperone [Kofleriaceae bacterium]
MCLGVPGKIVTVTDEDGVRMGRVDFGGVARQVCLDHVREAVVGDYVLVHVGFALSRLDEDEARRVFELLTELDKLQELGP